MIGIHRHPYRIPTGLAAVRLMAGTLLALTICLQAAEAMPYRRAHLDDKIIVESGEASQVNEFVRSRTNGIVVAQMVKVGDKVKKGQVLGHVELSPTKYQLDLAKLGIESSGPLESARGQAEAWEATYQETEQSVRRRLADKSRLEWADAMRRKYQGDYQTQLENKKVREVQYDYWEDQYERCFFRSPADGVVTEVRSAIGKQVNHAMHLFTVANEDSYVLPLSVPAELAANVACGSTLPVRSTRDGFVSRGVVESIAPDPANAGKMIITLLLNGRDAPSDSASQIKGSKFDVLLPSSPPDDDSSQITRHGQDDLMR